MGEILEHNEKTWLFNFVLCFSANSLTNLPTLCLSIEDDGPAIQEFESNKIFERFYRIPGSSGNGCGLGLAIVKEIADLHQVRLLLFSSGSGGARFDLQFNEIDG